MSFAKNAIGFYLQLDDTLSPGLKTATKNYEKFVRSLDRLNEQGFVSVNRGFRALSALAESFNDMPALAVKSYKKAYAGLNKVVKPIKQVIELEIKEGKGLARHFAKAVTKGLAKAKWRMSAVMPARKNSTLFQTENLRGAYHNQVQPPDYMGSMRIPKFKKGGTVKAGSREGIDDVLAMLGKNEMVLPADAAKKLKGLARTARMSKGLTSAYKDVQDLITAMPKLAAAAASGDKQALARYSKAFTAVNNAARNIDTEFGKMNKTVQMRLNPSVETVKQQLKEMLVLTSKTVGNAQAMENRFKRLNKEVSKTNKWLRFFGVNEAVKAISAKLEQMRNAAAQTFGAAGGEKVMAFNESIRETGRLLGFTNDEFVALRDGIANQADSRISIDLLKESVEALRAAGATTVEQFLKYDELGASAAKGGLKDFSGTLFQIGEAYNLNTESLAKLTNQTIEFSQKSGVGAENTQKLMDTLASAAEGTPEALAAMSKMGISSDMIEAFKSGDASAAMTQYMTKLAEVAQASDSAEAVKNALGIEIQTSQFIALRKHGVEPTIAALKKGQDEFDAMGGGVNAVKENVSNLDTMFTRFANTLTGALQRTFPGVISFFEELGPLSGIVTGALGHLLAVGISFFGKRLLGLFAKLGPYLAPIMSGLLGIVKAIGAAIAGVFTIGAAVAGAFIAAAAAVWYFQDEIGEIYEWLWEKTVGIWDSIGAYISERIAAITGLVTVAGEKITGVWDSITSWFGDDETAVTVAATQNVLPSREAITSAIQANVDMNANEDALEEQKRSNQLLGQIASGIAAQQGPNVNVNVRAPGQQRPAVSDASRFVAGGG